jgi:hypothetical protein
MYAPRVAGGDQRRRSTAAGRRVVALDRGHDGGGGDLAMP